MQGKQFLYFFILALIFVGFIGGYISDWVVTTFGLSGIIGYFVGFGVMIAPLWFALRRWGRKAGV